mmetsp:Transcript_60590/g.169286  ORF Transcript_60590/g.169286 Transcript_60590/m.169286 type:complete len:336 (+) Transcript_60590:784-1791(+)
MGVHHCWHGHHERDDALARAAPREPPRGAEKSAGGDRQRLLSPPSDHGGPTAVAVRLRLREGVHAVDARRTPDGALQGVGGCSRAPRGPRLHDQKRHAGDHERLQHAQRPDALARRRRVSAGALHGGARRRCGPSGRRRAQRPAPLEVHAPGHGPPCLRWIRARQSRALLAGGDADAVLPLGAGRRRQGAHDRNLRHRSHRWPFPGDREVARGVGHRHREDRNAALTVCFGRAALSPTAGSPTSPGRISCAWGRDSRRQTPMIRSKSAEVFRKPTKRASTAFGPTQRRSSVAQNTQTKFPLFRCTGPLNARRQRAACGAPHRCARASVFALVQLS